MEVQDQKRESSLKYTFFKCILCNFVSFLGFDIHLFLIHICC